MRSEPTLPAAFVIVVRPIQAFFRLEAASGILLLAAAVAALAWANSPAAASYEALWTAPIVLSVAGRGFELDLHHLVNDGLMTIFFFVVGLEIKRELAVGELSSRAQAALPLVAALGGMVVPAAIFVALNRGGPGMAGWAVPMATDIAFTVGVLTLLRGRVPHALVVFVTALAIFDDIGGILVIALFYGHGLDARWLVAAAAVAAAAFAMGRAHVRSGFAYAAALAALWWSLHEGGIHATLAGVVVGMAVPARASRRPYDVLQDLAAHTRRLAADKDRDDELEGAEVLAIEERLEELGAPLSRLEHLLHPWVAFAIMPVFALANSGVSLGGEGATLAGPVALGIALGLVAGKTVGVFGATWVALRLGLAPSPGGASPAKLLGASILTGIGFTVALFIASLAFSGAPALLAQAKLGIVAGSLVAGVAGALVLRATRRVEPGP